jgi:Ricin-type beta-trefoil lectin domain
MIAVLRRTGSLLAAVVAAFLALSIAVPAAHAWDYKLIRNGEDIWFQDVCLEVDNASWTVGASVTVDWCTQNGMHQMWIPVDPNDDDYRQLKVQHTGLCLDVKAASAADGAQIVQNTCSSSRPSQQWTFVYKSYNRYLIVNRLSGKCLDKSGNNVVLWGCHGWAWQQWANPVSS